LRSKLACIALIAALSGCSLASQIGGVETGKCIGAELDAKNPLAMPVPLIASGQITFSAPAGTRFALCSW